MLSRQANILSSADGSPPQIVRPTLIVVNKEIHRYPSLIDDYRISWLSQITGISRQLNISNPTLFSIPQTPTLSPVDWTFLLEKWHSLRLVDIKCQRHHVGVVRNYWPSKFIVSAYHIYIAIGLLLIVVAMFMQPHLVEIEVSDTVRILKECIENVCGYPSENMKLGTNSGRAMIVRLTRLFFFFFALIYKQKGKLASLIQPTYPPSCSSTSPWNRLFLLILMQGRH